MDAVRFDGPDWFSNRIPLWEKLLAPLMERAKSEPVHVLEVGSYEGRSAAWLWEHIVRHHEGSTLTCIDWPVEGTGERLRANLDELATDGLPSQIEVILRRSRDVLPEVLRYEPHLSLAYVDGSHEAPDVLFDSVCCLELLQVGGILIWDDYHWDPTRDGGVHAPQLAIDAFVTVNRERLKLLHRGVQVAVEKTQ